MRYIHLSLFLLLGSMVLTGCSSHSAEKPKVPNKPASELYLEAKSSLDARNYSGAIELLEALDTRYPFGPYSIQTQLDLIYAYYKEHETPKALANIDRFLRNNPTHEDLDYIYYMRGLTNMGASYNYLHSKLNIDRSDRDPGYPLQAFNDFKTLLTRFPNSSFADDARNRMVDLKNTLARHEIAAAHYYIKRKAYIAAVNRAKYVIENFGDTKQNIAALNIMIEGYHQLGLTNLEQRAKQILALNKG